MNNLDIAGLLQTYAYRAAKATTTSQLRKIIKELREELDLRKVRMDDKQFRVVATDIYVLNKVLPT